MTTLFLLEPGHVSCLCCQSCFSLLYCFSEKSPRAGELEQNCCSELKGGVHSNPASLNPVLPQQATLLMVLLLMANTTGQISSSFSVPENVGFFFFYLAKLVHHQH